jgi:uncharacterized protein (TIGR02145 family)
MKINMEKAKPIITVAAVFILLFSYGGIPDNIDHKGGSNSDQISSQTVQTKTQSTQTGTKSVQTKPKPAQPGSKSTQSVPTKPKSAQTGSKSTKSVQTKPKPAQTGTKSTQTKSKSVQKSTNPVPVSKIKDPGTVRIGTQSWAAANLNVSTFRNGDSIPNARTNEEWVKAGDSGKPAWCYYNNDPANGKKYGKLYNWYAVNDPRGLAPDGWTIPSDADWAKLTNYLGGPNVSGEKMKSTAGWIDDYNGNNESGFTGLPGGYRVENGIFLKLGSIGSWWSLAETKGLKAIDYYLALNRSLGRSISPKQRGESIRCIRN